MTFLKEHFFIIVIAIFFIIAIYKMLKKTLFSKHLDTNRIIPYPVAFHTVDIIPYWLDELNGKYYVILGKKEKYGNAHITPGGFMDVIDSCTEAGALRELKEELNIKIPFKEGEVLTLTNELNKLQYLGSTFIDDERYRNSIDKIITSVFAIRIDRTEHLIVPSDDLTGCNTFTLKFLLENKEEIMLEKHIKLIEMFEKRLRINKEI